MFQKAKSQRYWLRRCRRANFQPPSPLCSVALKRCRSKAHMYRLRHPSRAHYVRAPSRGQPLSASSPWHRRRSLEPLVPPLRSQSGCPAAPSRRWTGPACPGPGLHLVYQSTSFITPTHIHRLHSVVFRRCRSTTCRRTSGRRWRWRSQARCRSSSSRTSCRGRNRTSAPRA